MASAELEMRMPESPEHEFLSRAFNDVIAEFARLDLYRMGSTDRQLFDFSCTIERDWSRVLVGQTLWRNRAGVEKDVRSLLLDEDAEIRAYIVPAEAATLTRVERTVEEFRASHRFDGDLFRLVRFTVPKFDADDENQRALVAAELREQVTDKILLKIVFGWITARDVTHFLDVTGMRVLDRGLNLRMLDYFRRHGFVSLRSTGQALGARAETVKQRLEVLRGADFVRPSGPFYEVTEKGYVFLELIDRTAAETREGHVSDELLYLWERLGCPLADLRGDRLTPAGMLLVQSAFAMPDVPAWEGLDWGVVLKRLPAGGPGDGR